VELLLRLLPVAPARVLDVGGGPGVYASWLASLGYEVTLVDPVVRPGGVIPAAFISRQGSANLPSTGSRARCCP